MYATWVSGLAAADPGVPTVTSAQAVSRFAQMPTAAAVQIKDSAAAISKNLDALQSLGAKITSITLSDPANPLVVSNAQRTSAADTLAKVQGTLKLSVSGVAVADASAVLGADGVVNVSIADSNASISAGLAALQALGSKIKSITQTGVKGAIAVDVTGATSYASTLAKIDGGKYTLAISDSQANIRSSLTALKALGTKLASITRNSGSASFEFNAAEAVGFASTLAKVDGGSAQVKVTDTSANVIKGLVGLQGLGTQLQDITVTDPGQTLVVTAKLVASGVGALGKINNSYSLAVSDTSASIAKAIDSLQAVTSHIAAITQSGSKTAMAMTGSQRASAATTLAKIDGGDYSLVLSGVLRSHLASISGDARVKAMSVSITDGDISGLNDSRIARIAVSGASLVQAAAAAADGRVTSIAISDSAANFTSANVNALYESTKAKLAVISKIEANDATRQTLSVKVADYLRYVPTFLKKFSGMALEVDFSGSKVKGTEVVKDSMSWYKTVANPNGSFNIQQWNGQPGSLGAWVNFATLREGANFIKFADETAFLDTGNKQLNAMLNLGTDNWMMNPATKRAATSGAELMPGVYALVSSSVRTTIKYAFYQNASETTVSGDPGTSAKNAFGFNEMTASQKAAVQDAFDYFSSLINVKFELAGSLNEADIKFGTNDQGTVSGGYATGGNSENGGVGLFLNNAGLSGTTNSDLTPGGYGWTTLVHEIGHTLGLKHPGNYNAGGGGTPGPYLSTADDNKRTTVMSYKDAADSFNWVDTGGGSYKGGTISPVTLMKQDVLALQFLYGRNTSGVSTSNGGSASLANFQTTTFSGSWMGMQTIATSSRGTNLDLSVVTRSNIVDLRWGAFSSINIQDVSYNLGIGGTQKQTFFNMNNVALAFGAMINSVIGGVATDVFYVTRRDSIFDGGDGRDKLMLYGVAADWTYTLDSNTGAITYTNKKDFTEISARNIEAVGYYKDTSLPLLHSRVNLVV